MVNMTDGKSSGIALVYFKEGTIYPLATTEESIKMLDILIGSTLGNIFIGWENPIASGLGPVAHVK